MMNGQDNNFDYLTSSVTSNYAKLPGLLFKHTLGGAGAGLLTGMTFGGIKGMLPGALLGAGIGTLAAPSKALVEIWTTLGEVSKALITRYQSQNAEMARLAREWQRWQRDKEKEDAKIMSRLVKRQSEFALTLEKTTHHLKQELYKAKEPWLLLRERILETVSKPFLDLDHFFTKVKIKAWQFLNKLTNTKIPEPTQKRSGVAVRHILPLRSLIPQTKQTASQKYEANWTPLKYMTQQTKMKDKLFSKEEWLNIQHIITGQKTETSFNKAYRQLQLFVRSPKGNFPPVPVPSDLKGKINETEQQAYERLYNRAYSKSPMSTLNSRFFNVPGFQEKAREIQGGLQKNDSMWYKFLNWIIPWNKEEKTPKTQGDIKKEDISELFHKTTGKNIYVFGMNFEVQNTQQLAQTFSHMQSKVLHIMNQLDAREKIDTYRLQSVGAYS